MELKILGIILVSFGSGMLVAQVFPWWGIIAAIFMVAAGVFLILKKCWKKLPLKKRESISFYNQMARVTLPERRHLVQMYIDLIVPLSLILTFLTLAFQVLLARLLTWLRLMLILWPVCIVFSQISHFAITCTSLNSIHDITILFYQKAHSFASPFIYFF